MSMDKKTLEAHLKGAFPEAEVTLTDLAGDDNHWHAEIVSSKFIGLTRVKQHQLVYDALQGKVGGVLHALSLKTSAPKEQK